MVLLLTLTVYGQVMEAVQPLGYILNQQVEAVMVVYLIKSNGLFTSLRLIS